MEKDIKKLIKENVEKAINLAEEQLICESTYNRVINYLEKYECAIITAWRTTFKDATEKTATPYSYKKEKGQFIKGNQLQVGDDFTTDTKRYYNTELKAVLLRLGYSVTKLKGTYREADKGKESQEESFLVVNINNDENFKETIFKLSELYNQDSFLYTPKDSKEGFLIGTNNGSFPGYKNVSSSGWLKACAQSMFMSRFGGRGFTFTNGEKVSKDDKDRIEKLNSDDNNYEDDEIMTFGKRKSMRINESKLIEKKINENVKKILSLESFERYGINAKSSISHYVSEFYKRNGKIF